MLTLLLSVAFGAPSLRLPAPDRAALALEDAARAREGLPTRFAVPHSVDIDPTRDGSWRAVDANHQQWTLRISAHGADSLNLGFDDVFLPPGAQLSVQASDGLSALSRVFDARDNKPHHQLWTPILPSDDLLLRLTLPTSQRPSLRLHLSQVGVGYQKLGGSKSGLCNIDTSCADADLWHQEVSAVAVYSLRGSMTCTGFMVNNTAGDQTPYFQTAKHCGVRATNAPSMVVYWNFESPVCGAQSGGSHDDTQSGATHLATYGASDFTLVLLDDLPDPAWQISYAGWDHSGIDANSAVAIHHPGLDEKSISFEFDPTVTASYFGSSSPGDGSHVRVVDWDLGTTEGGSSGSPLFNQDHRVIGQLHGGSAACGNNKSDWYGKLAMSWDGGGSSSTRLSDWLDPTGSGQLTVDTLSPSLSALYVRGDALQAEGPVGGPFPVTEGSYFLHNMSSAPLDFEVVPADAWWLASPASGSLAPGEGVDVIVSLDAAADLLPAGSYSSAIAFNNLTDGDGDTSREASLTVGVPWPVYSFPLDSDPGWSTDGDWAWGVPQGGGGSAGSPDPSAGFSGSAVYGYNLAGDYGKISPQHLTSSPLDLSGYVDVAVGYWRWLGVETTPYDRASFSVSTDGVQFSQVWSNSNGVDDGAWVWVQHDISQWADNAPALSLRWTMGKTDNSVDYCGWNLDEIVVLGCDDLDGDGHGDPQCGGDDCDDLEPTTAAGFAERCDDGVDNDCDGEVDEANCDQDGDGFDADQDCDDGDASVYPGADEWCGNGLDDDCDQQIDEADAVDALRWFQDDDGDGYGRWSLDACEQPSGYVADGGDCDDGDMAVHPGADEVCDGVDNDCDGTTDLDALDAEALYIDDDLDGYGADAIVACMGAGVSEREGDCDDADPALNPGVEELCDGLDNNCNGQVDDDAVDASVWAADADGDSYTDDRDAVSACEAPEGYREPSILGDCDDSDAAVYPGADEVVGDGVDQSCDGADAKGADKAGGCGCVAAGGPRGGVGLLLIGALALLRRRRSC